MSNTHLDNISNTSPPPPTQVDPLLLSLAEADRNHVNGEWMSAELIVDDLIAAVDLHQSTQPVDSLKVGLAFILLKNETCLIKSYFLKMKLTLPFLKNETYFKLSFS